MVVALPADVLCQYERFSLYNSPYVAHDRGCAIDLYPGRNAETALSPVEGRVLDTKRVKAPPTSYAAAHDFLVVIDCGEYLARTLHVDPAVEPGDRVAVGARLGELVRAGFFAPWVSNHVHLGFRERGANPYRASGSLPIVPEVSPRPLDWDGSGTVLESEETYAVLDTPVHPSPGEFAGIAGSFLPERASESDTSAEKRRAVLDGGLPHYDGGGELSGTHGLAAPDDGSITLLDTEIGFASDRDVSWRPVSVYANDRPITGLSLFCARDRGFGAKLVCPETAFERGESLTVSIRPAE